MRLFVELAHKRLCIFGLTAGKGSGGCGGEAERHQEVIETHGELEGRSGRRDEDPEVRQRKLEKTGRAKAEAAEIRCMQEDGIHVGNGQRRGGTIGCCGWWRERRITCTALVSQRLYKTVTFGPAGLGS